MKKYSAYTPTQIIIVVGVIVVIISLIVGKVFPKFQEKTFEPMYKNEVQKISNMLDNIELAENRESFFDTSMYIDEVPSDYSSSSGYFLKKYIGIKKDCTNSLSECFAQKYTNEKKEPVTPDFGGVCAILRDGVSVCLKPQIDETPAHGIMDLNGKSAPNVLGRDFRTFELDKRKKPVIEYEEADSVITY